MDEWVKVSNDGNTDVYTMVYQRLSLRIRENAFAYGIIKLDGADNQVFTHN